MTTDDKERLDQLLRDAAAIIKGVPDTAVGPLLGDGILDELLKAIAEPKSPGQGTMYDFLLANRTRLQLLAQIHHAITMNYSMRGHVAGAEVFVSPHFNQWVENGVVFLQGRERFQGLIGLYQDGQVRFAVAARDNREGDVFGPGDLLFVGPDEARSAVTGTGDNGGGFAAAIGELQAMLARKENKEAQYQAFLQAHPWVLGAQYKLIQSHRALDDANIPDFTGVRARDGARDIIEIKPPFLPLFTSDHEFRTDLLRAWDQCERYLDFARIQRQYLLDQKGLRFETPHCYLILGQNLNGDQRGRLERKQRMNPSITILTYNDLLAMGRSVVDLLERLTRGDGSATESTGHQNREEGDSRGDTLRNNSDDGQL